MTSDVLCTSPRYMIEAGAFAAKTSVCPTPLTTSSTLNRSRRTSLSGVCVDSGAEGMFMGWDQAVVYVQYAQIPLNVRLSDMVFRFGDHHSTSTVMMDVRISVLGDAFMILNCHVVRAVVPVLIGLNVFRAFGLTMNFGENVLRSTDPSWALPFNYRSGHAFISPSFPFTCGWACLDGRYRAVLQTMDNVYVPSTTVVYGTYTLSMRDTVPNCIAYTCIFSTRAPTIFEPCFAALIQSAHHRRCAHS